MKTIQRILGLKREAILLDSRLFILKAMVAISLGFILGQFFPFSRLDMVSVLLGVMYNLDAINVAGLKGGIQQLLASALGALTTGLLVYLTGYNINFFVIALGIGFTLYIALKIDYRMVSPVAIFTSIYMTQLLQKDALGYPSVLLTFQVRILALSLGIAIALICNFLFSILYYRNLGKRRLEFVKIQGVIGLKKTKEVLLSDEAAAMSYQPVLAGVFNDIEMVKANLETMMKESQIPFNAKEKQNLKIYYKMIIEVKTMIHLAYDMLYIKGTTNQDLDPASLNELDEVILGLSQLDFTDLKQTHIQDTDQLDPSQFPKAQSRIADNLNLLAYHYQTMISQLPHLK
jgi:hypothetical protein